MKNKPLILRYLALFICVGVSGALLLHTSQLVQRKEAELKRFKAALDREEQMIGVLEAEWAQLNSPYRLEGLVKDHLDLSLPDTMSIAPDFDVLPEARDAFILEPDDAQQDLKIDVVAVPKISVPQPKTKPHQNLAPKSPEKKSPPEGVEDSPDSHGGISDLINRLRSEGEGR